MKVEEIFEQQNQLNESQGIVIFHGDNYNTSRLDPRLMNNGNNQEGIGIYFSDELSTAKAYGKHVVKATVNPRKLIPARQPMSSFIPHRTIVNILKDMMKFDREAMFYMATDYGAYLTEPEELEEYHLDEVASMMGDEEVRNFQTTIAQVFDVVPFVKSWNRHTRIDGTFHNHNHNERWYAIINPNVRVERVDG